MVYHVVLLGHENGVIQNVFQRLLSIVFQDVRDVVEGGNVELRKVVRGRMTSGP